MAVGGGLTEVASALKVVPRIAERMTLVGIGGDDSPQAATGETNFNTDAVAARHIYNETATPMRRVGVARCQE